MADQLIVVPLDGSELAERAIPYAALHAKTIGGRILLATVWEGADEALENVLPAVAADLKKEGKIYFDKYLADTSAKYAVAGFPIESEVLAGKPAETVLKFVADRKASLLAFATHGRSGLGRWWFGSVAGELAHRAMVPRLIVGPKVLSQPTKTIKVDGVLVPLDGSKLAECAVNDGVRIAKAFDANLHLVQVISPAAQTFLFDVPSVSSGDIMTQIEDGVKQYLKEVGTRYAKEAKIMTCVLHGAPADALVDYIKEHGIDLVVMASHGHGGLARVALGSVADRVLQGDAPVYLVRPEADD